MKRIVCQTTLLMGYFDITRQLSSPISIEQINISQGDAIQNLQQFWIHEQYCCVNQVVIPLVTLPLPLGGDGQTKQTKKKLVSKHCTTLH